MFIETKRNKDGLVSAEDVVTYAQREQKVKDYSTEIDHMERQEAIDRETNAPTSTPITDKVDTKTGCVADAYKDASWNVTRVHDGVPYEVCNALRVGMDSEGGVRPARTLLVVA